MTEEHWIALAIGCFTVLGGFTGLGIMLFYLHKATERYFDARYETVLKESEIIRAEMNTMLTEKLGKIESKLEIIESRFNVYDAKFESIELRLINLESGIADLTQAVIQIKGQEHLAPHAHQSKEG